MFIMLKQYIIMAYKSNQYFSYQHILSINTFSINLVPENTNTNKKYLEIIVVFVKYNKIKSI